MDLQQRMLSSAQTSSQEEKDTHSLLVKQSDPLKEPERLSLLSQMDPTVEDEELSDGSQHTGIFVVPVGLDDGSSISASDSEIEAASSTVMPYASETQSSSASRFGAQAAIDLKEVAEVLRQAESVDLEQKRSKPGRAVPLHNAGGVAVDLSVGSELQLISESSIGHLGVRPIPRATGETTWHGVLSDDTPIHVSIAHLAENLRSLDRNSKRSGSAPGPLPSSGSIFKSPQDPDVMIADGGPLEKRSWFNWRGYQSLSPSQEENKPSSTFTGAKCIPYTDSAGLSETHKKIDPDDSRLCPDCRLVHNPYEHHTQKGPDRGANPCHEKVVQSKDLVTGLWFQLRHLGTVHITIQHPSSVDVKMRIAQESMERLKLDSSSNHRGQEVELQISIERLKLFSNGRKNVIMDYALHTVLYICDLEPNYIVLIARRLTGDQIRDLEKPAKNIRQVISERRTSKAVCHVFETVEAERIAQIMSQAFQTAYDMFLSDNGFAADDIEEVEQRFVLESQSVVSEDLHCLSDARASQEVVIQKKRGEPIGIMLMESGWGSILPTVFIAHIANYSPASLQGRLQVGDLVLACNGASLVGVPMTTCHQLIKDSYSCTCVVLNIVHCPPVVDVVLRRPDTKFQLGFHVQNGVIFSILRGGLADRGGVRVGHRIIEINGESMVKKSNEHVINVLSSSTGEIRMKTMPVGLYKLMTGQDLPSHL